MSGVQPRGFRICMLVCEVFLVGSFQILALCSRERCGLRRGRIDLCGRRAIAEFRNALDSNRRRSKWPGRPAATITSGFSPDLQRRDGQAKDASYDSAALQYTGYETDDENYSFSDRQFSTNDLTATENLQNGLEELVTEISREAFWAFNCPNERLEEQGTRSSSSQPHH